MLTELTESSNCCVKEIKATEYYHEALIFCLWVAGSVTI